MDKGIQQSITDPKALILTDPGAIEIPPPPIAVVVGQTSPQEYIWVTLSNPSHPNDSVQVEMKASPEITLSTSSFSLIDGGYQKIYFTVNKVSERVADYFIKAYVGSMATSLREITGVTFTVPTIIRGPDTPSGVGMPDRISTGFSNWGSYVGKMTVAPALLGLHKINVSVAKPGTETVPPPLTNAVYGSASVIQSDVTRACLNGYSILRIYGFGETLPMFDRDTGAISPGYASHLRLVSTLGLHARSSSGFSVAPIPIATVFYPFISSNGSKYQLTPGEDAVWTAGMIYSVGLKMDGGTTSNIRTTEHIVNLVGQIGASNGDFSGLFSPDANVVTLPVDSITPTLSAARAAFAKGGDPPPRENITATADQAVRYVNTAVLGIPSKENFQAAPLVEFSGYTLAMGVKSVQISNTAPKFEYYYIVTRQAYEALGAKKGLLTGWDNYNYEYAQFRIYLLAK